MNKVKIFQALEQLITANVYDKIKDSVIVKDKNSYKLFDTYCIDKFEGEYQVNKIRYDEKLMFSSLKNSVTWVVLDKKNDIMGSKRLVELDQKLSGLEINIKIYEKLLQKTKESNNKILYYTKLIESKVKKERISRELEDLAEKSKRWQLKRFEQSSLK